MDEILEKEPDSFMDTLCHQFKHIIGDSIDTKNPEKFIEKIVNYYEDILKALEESKKRAEAANLSKTEFVFNMSHDIKTPLAGIIGIAELLTYRLDNENLQLAQNLLMSGQQLLNFFDTCLEIFKLENNDTIIPSDRFNLKALLFEIYDLFLPSVKTKNLNFDIFYDEQIPEYLLGNRLGLYRILLNLVSNAVKFTHNGFIKISISCNDQSTHYKVFLTFIIEDSGIGIPKNKQHIIFDRFTRLIPSYKGTYNGSGIGLYTVQKFVQMMGGDIKVNSEESAGSKFIVNLPFEVSLSQEEIPSSKCINEIMIPIKNTRKALRNPRVLLVEDNLTAQLMENVLLSSLHCQVDPVDCGEKALELFKIGKYDLIFMDIGLPGIQGDNVAKVIRQKELGTGYHVPIVALTAHTSDDTNKYYLSIGMEEILKKPLSREQAKKTISEYFNVRAL